MPKPRTQQIMIMPLKHSREGAFTLIELSIVLVIIGLVIGGLLVVKI